MYPQRKYLLITALLLLAFVSAPALAQTPASQSSAGEIQSRIRQLETQMDAMRDELTKLKQAVPTDSANVTEPQSIRATSDARQGAQQFENKNASQRQETKTAPAEKRPAGIELGSVRAVPYGTIYFNAFGNSGGTNNADIPLFATPTDATGGYAIRELPSAFYTSSRRSSPGA